MAQKVGEKPHDKVKERPAAAAADQSLPLFCIIICCYGWLQVFIILNFFFFFKETLVTQYQLLLNSKYTKELVYRPWTSCPEFSDLTTYLITLVTIYPETLIFCIVFLCRLIVLLGPVCELKPRPSFRSTYHAQTVQ